MDQHVSSPGGERTCNSVGNHARIHRIKRALHAYDSSHSSSCKCHNFNNMMCWYVDRYLLRAP